MANPIPDNPVPLTTPDTEIQASDTASMGKPIQAAKDLENYINTNHSQGYGNIDPNIQVALAQGATNHPAHQSVLGSITNGLSTAWKSVGNFFHDSSTTSPITIEQKIADHFNNSKIKMPTASDIQVLQQHLIDNKFAPAGAKADGTWGGAWNQALYLEQLQGKQKPGLGTTSAQIIFNSIIDPLMPSHALPMIIDSVKSLGSDVKKLVEDEIDRGKLIVASARQAAGGRKMTAAENARANDLTSIHNQVSTVGTYLTLATMANGAGEIGTATKAGIAAGKEAGAKTVAGALVKDLGKDVAPKNKWLMNSLFPEMDNGMRRFAFTKGLQNSPANNFVTNVNKVATSMFDGYQTGRMALATPYRLPVVGIAGDIGTTLLNQSLKQSLIGNAENFLGDHNTGEAQVLNHLKPISGNVGNMLNLFSIALHPGTYDATLPTSATIGSKIENARQALTNALQQNKVIANWERGTGANYKAIVSELAKRGIDSSYVDKTISADLNKNAANHSALTLWQARVQKGLVDANDTTARQTFLQNMSSQILNDKTPDGLLKKARDSYLLKPDQFAADLTRSVRNLKADTTYKYSNDFLDKIAADKIYAEEVLPHLDSVVTPHTLAQNAITPEVAPLPYGYSEAMPQMLAEANKSLETAKAVEAAARQKLENAGISLKGTVKPISAKMVASGKATKEQLAASNEWNAAYKVMKSAQIKVDEIANSKNPKIPNPFTVDVSKPLNENTSVVSHGYMKNERQTSGDAQDQAMKFYKQLEKINPRFKAPSALSGESDWQTFLGDSAVGSAQANLAEKLKSAKKQNNFSLEAASEKELTLRNKIFKYLGEELNVNIKDLHYTPTNNLIDLIVAKADTLAGDVYIPSDAPEALKNAIKKLNELGYKPVFGKDIGHTFVTNPLSKEEMGTGQTRLSNMADKLGLNFEQVDPHVASKHAYAEMQNVLQDYINSAKPGELPVWGTSSHYMMDFLHNVIKPDINAVGAMTFRTSASNLPARILHPIQGNTWNPEIKKIMEREGITRSEAKTKLLQTLATDAGPQFWTRKQVVDALTTTNDRNVIVNKYGKEVESAGMTTKAANDFYYAMQKGLRSAPAYVEGLNPFVKMLDSSFGLANVPLSINGRRVLDLTGNLKKELMAFRYQGSYRFAYLRAVKSALKGVTENIPFTLDAGRSLKELGQTTEAQAYALRDKLLGANPEQKEVTDYINQEYEARDYFNVYNPRAIEARNLWYLWKDAVANVGGDASLVNKDQVMKKFNNITSYGNRTAAEKSVNAFFFPFSFEKTVVRQLGGHLLDDPATRLIASAAVAAYNSADGQQVKDWMEKNMPLFAEVEKFNPFYHGVGVGQAGGIFRMPYEVGKTLSSGVLAQMLSPKPITNMASAKSALALVPALNDLNKILGGFDLSGKKPVNPGGELATTLRTSMWEAGNSLSKLFGHENKNPWQSQGHLPYDVQQTNAWNLRSALLTKTAQVLEANRGGANYAWPSNIPGVGGQKVSSETVSNLVHHVYPSWDPGSILKAVAENKTATGEERASLQAKSPTYLPLYDNFIKASNQIGSLISKDSITNTAALADATVKMRKAAYELSMQDSSFYNFYKKYYQSKFGPLEEIK